MNNERIEKISRKEYRKRKKNGEISPLDDIYKAHDYKGRIIYTIYHFEKEKKENEVF